MSTVNGGTSFKADPEMMKEIADEIKQKMEIDYTNDKATFLTLSGQLQTIWDSEAHDKYVEKLGELDEDFDEIKQTILNFVDAINRAADSYRTQEEANKKLADVLTENF